MPHYIITPIHTGDGLSFPDWVTLLTLSFAPLIAHIVAGAPRPSYLCNKRPRWDERICHYNPTSIIWRYYSILDRRLRSRSWSRPDLAAANALFWTEKGWDGNEHMVIRSLPHCTYLPSSAHANALSDETFKSIVTALQGFQELYLVILSYRGLYFADIQYLGADRIFYPLALLGLLRIFATPWLSSDFRYTSRLEIAAALVDKANEPSSGRLSLDSLIQMPCETSIALENYRLPSCWRSRILRTTYMSILLGIWWLTLLWVVPIPYNGRQGRYFTVTSFLVAIVYLTLTSVSVAVHLHYFIGRQTTSTIIPCASHMWYKIYTIVMFAVMAVISIISLVETTKSACGKYTSLPPTNTNWVCAGPNATAWTIDSRSNATEVIGMAVKYPYAARGTILKEGEFWLRNFSATCIGGWTSELRLHAMGLNAVDFTGLVDWGNGTTTEL
ncbi:hypothetical protein NPX13_g581 [Xylaria arbuscula]|uniref:Uncharacterized protein n=1 Tax=Xylaria arbuscula TaxID=114810 RepID=A0A9W8NN90_9PEZI|nr:hypothetical protein NPX13_g581 [Xylaria arbuscula]